MKQIAYVRTSRHDEHIENQIDAIRKVSPDAKFFMDAGVSGTVKLDQREGFQKMLRYIKDEKPDELFVYEISRLGRMMYDVLEMVNTLEEEHGVRVRSVSPKEEWMNTSDKSIRNLILAIFSWVAEREREMLSQRTKEGLARARSEGVRLGRPERKINWVKVKELREPDKYGRKVPYTVISRILEVPYPTLMAYKKDRTDLDV